MRATPTVAEDIEADTEHLNGRGELGNGWKDREALLIEYHPLAEYLARRFRGRGEPLEDLVQVASIGLLKALDRFDPARGVSFVTYATPTILGELKRHFRDEASWPVRMPRRLQETSLRIRLAVAELHQELGRSPTIPEIAERTGLEEDAILETMEAEYAGRPVSLDGSVDEDGQAPVDVADHDRGFDLAESWASLSPLVKQLPERERKILVLRFFDDLTQTEIAERLGISQMHVSRLLSRSLRRLREAIDAAEKDSGREPLDWPPCGSTGKRHSSPVAPPDWAGPRWRPCTPRGLG